MSIKLENGFRGAVLCDIQNLKKPKRFNVKVINDYIMIYSFDSEIPIYNGKWNINKNCYIIDKINYHDGSYKKYGSVELRVLSIIHRFILVKEYDNYNCSNAEQVLEFRGIDEV